MKACLCQAIKLFLEESRNLHGLIDLSQKIIKQIFQPANDKYTTKL